MKPLFLTALGVINSAGSHSQEVYQNIFMERKRTAQKHILISGRETQVKRVLNDLPQLPSHLSAFESRNNRLLLHATLQIENEVQSIIEKYGRSKIGVVLGTSTSGIEETEKAFSRRNNRMLPDDFRYYKQEIASPSEFMRAYLGLEGICYTTSTACTSSAKAFIEGRRLIDAGLCEAVVVGGVDTVSSLTLDGFDSLDSLSPTETNPFSKNRNGINIGEGAAVFILSKNKSEVEFLGHGESSDGYHISSPDPEGKGAEIAIREALRRAQIQERDLGYINLHGTGTEKNDLMESWMTNRIFGEDILVSSTKPFTGHTLGAAGAQEAALCFLALSKVNQTKKLPVHVWDQDQDQKLARLRFVHESDQLRLPVCMSNSFAFGGNNVSLIFRGVDE